MILEKTRATIKKYGLIKQSDRIIVAVSGGPDSTALLHLLNSLSKDLKISLHIAHLDHMLRPGSSSDAKFVRNLGKKLNLPVTCAKVDLKSSFKKGSIEEIARQERLKFLSRLAKKIKATKVALGHTHDDQAETVLMRLLRGSGLYGLSAISVKRNINGLEIIRPLIHIKREEIELFLKNKGVKPCRDSSNSENIYLRNKIRNQLLPYLERRYCKNIREVLNNTAETAGLDYDYLLTAAKLHAKKLGKRINLTKFLKLHPALQRIIIRLNISRIKGDTRAINFQHIREIEDLILNRPSGAIVDLPKGVSVVKKGNFLSFHLRRADNNRR